MPRAAQAAIALALGSAAWACTVGPDFHPPQPPAAPRFPASPVPAETASADAPAGQAQHLVTGRDVPAEWWTLFECAALDALVRQALRDSPLLAQARAKLAKAQEDLAARRGATTFPKVDASVGANRVDVHPESFGVPALPVDVPFTLYTATGSVSYTLDLFGRNRRELEALRATLDYQGFELEAARLMLAGNVVAAAIEEASLRDQIEATEAIAGLQARQLEVVERLEQLGGVARLDVVRQRGELARTRASLPALRERRERTRHRLAVYLGQAPSEAAPPELRLADLKLPSELPLSLPSELARQRPDIRAAEALLHEASARVGVATANLYPRITLSATAGSLTTTLSNLLGSGTGFALLGATIAQPLFHGGELKAQKRSAVAAFDQAGAAYRQVVLAGFQEVADVLVALDTDATTLRERTETASLAREAYDITSKRYETGGVSLLDVLDAQRQHLSASLEQTRAMGDRYVESAALFQALGGGWWTRPPATGTTPGAPP